MGEFVECVNGISEAAKYLNFPVVSGNVSFYNETKDKGIKPTPSIGGIGLIEDYKNMITMNLKKDCLLYTSPSPRDGLLSRMPSSA